MLYEVITLDFSAKGTTSRFADMFLTFDAVFRHGASEDDLLAIYRPRPGLPFTPMTLADGSRRILWTTFTAEQIDIDVTSRQGQAYLDNILGVFASNGVTRITSYNVCYTKLLRLLADDEGAWSTLNLRLTDLDLEELPVSYGSEDRDTRVARRKLVWTPTVVRLPDPA